MRKLARHNSILQTVQNESITSQEQLRKALLRKGFRVTQATLSRDVHELGLVKGADGYQFPVGVPAAVAGEQVLPPAPRLVREFVLSVREAQNLIVIKTAVGSAGPVAASLDGEEWGEIVGTIAGDDTILIVTGDNRAAQKLARNIRGLMAG